MKARTLFLGLFTLLVLGGAGAGIWTFFQGMQKKNLFQEATTTEDLGQRVEKLKSFLLTYPDHEEAVQALSEAEKGLESQHYEKVSAVEELEGRIEALKGFLDQYPDHGEAKETLAKAEGEWKTLEDYRERFEASRSMAEKAASASTPKAWAEAAKAAEAAVAILDTEEARALIQTAKGNRSWALARLAETAGDLNGGVSFAEEAAKFLASDASLDQYRRSLTEKVKAYDQAVDLGRAAEGARDWEAARAAYEKASKINPGNPAPKEALERITDILRCMETLKAHFEIPSADVDQHGRPVTVRDGSRTDANTGLPCEIWLKDPKVEFVLVPAGEQAVTGGEGDGAKVTVEKAFYMGKYEVTNAQWKAVVKGHSFSFGENALPVVSVKWFQCKSYIDELNKRAGDGDDRPFTFRIPTEPQWEFASRAGSAGAYCGGDDEGTLAEFAWFKANAEDKAHPVGKKKPNAWGIFDIHGNVWEWCDSDKGGISQPVRGGSFKEEAKKCRCGHRIPQNPRRESKDLGLRLALELNIELPK